MELYNLDIERAILNSIIFDNTKLKEIEISIYHFIKLYIKLF